MDVSSFSNAKGTKKVISLAEINPRCVVSFIMSVRIGATKWSAKVVQNGSRPFCEVRTRIECNSANFSYAILMSFINSFAIKVDVAQMLHA